MIKVLYYGTAETHPAGVFCEKRLSDYYCICNFETDFMYEKNGKLHKGNAGEMLIVEPLNIIYHGPRKNAKQGFVNDWIYMHSKDIDHLFKKYPVPLNTAFFAGNETFLRRYIELVKKEDTLKSAGYKDKITYILSEMIIDLHRSYNNYKSRKSKFTAVEYARDMVMQNLEKEWSLSEMAESCGYSVSRFSALYKEKFGCSPKKDLIDERIKAAKRMLEYSDHSVTQISEKCGFATIFYFSKYFKEETGLSPSEYARKHRNILKP